MTGCGGDNSAQKPADDAGKTTIGVISHLNTSEIEYNEYMKK